MNVSRLTKTVKRSLVVLTILLGTTVAQAFNCDAETKKEQMKNVAYIMQRCDFMPIATTEELEKAEECYEQKWSALENLYPDPVPCSSAEEDEGLRSTVLLGMQLTNNKLFEIEYKLDHQ